MTKRPLLCSRRLWLAVLLLLARTGAGQTPAFDRALVCTASSEGISTPRRLAVDAQGNTLAAGFFNGTVTLGATTLTAAGASAGPGLGAPPDVFVAKLDAAGGYVWAAQAVGTLWEDVRGVAVDATGDVYVTGYFESYSVRFGSTTLYNSSSRADVFVAKLSGATGQWLWARRCGGIGSDDGAGVAVSAAGEVYLAGTVGASPAYPADFGPYTLSTAATPVFLAKLSAAGTWLWARQTGTSTGTTPAVVGMVLDAQGSIYLGGQFSAGRGTGSMSFGATTLTTQTPGIIGTHYPSSSGSDLFVAKFTDAGAPLWAVQGSPSGQNILTLTGLASDGAGHLYLAGTYSWLSATIGGVLLPNQSSRLSTPGAPTGQVSYGSDTFVARLNAATGAWDWAIRAGDTQGDGIGSVAADGQGRVYVAGYYYAGFANPLPGGGRVGLAQLDGATGAWRWTLPLLPSVGIETIQLDNAGRLLLGGWFGGATATFGPVTLAQQGGASGTTGYLARLASGPLAARATRQPGALQVWPNPGGGGPVWVQGPGPGQPVQVLDALGRRVSAGRMPASGPLLLALPAQLPAGLYVVQSAGRARQLVVE